VTSWTRFIERAPAAEHAVQVYDDVSELARSVAAYVAAGFGAGDPALLISTPDHWEAFVRELDTRGWDPAALERERMLSRVDAEELLDAFMDNELPSPERFHEVIGGLVDGTSERFPGRTIRAFGEMVDLLWRRGQERAAIALEELWNELAETRSFALLCGYHLDVFQLAVQRDALPEVMRTHSHTRTVEEPSRLAAAVDQALAEIVGPVRAARIYLDVAEHVPRGSLPRAQAVLSWLSTREAPLAHEILERARMHYARLRNAPLPA
jgi:MEDS: MEthanogen/methylotroph, DcmR Sensory domain